MNPTEVIAEALAKHQLVSDARCSCGGHNPPWHPEIDWRGLHIAHQASVIAALPDIAIVPRIRPCDGSGTCDTNIHIHGCYVGACDDPHDHVTASYHRAAAAEEDQ